MGRIRDEEPACIHDLLRPSCSICSTRRAHSQIDTANPRGHLDPPDHWTGKGAACRTCAALLPVSWLHEECERCTRKRLRLERRAGRTVLVMPPWTLRYSKRDWQEQALREWARAGCRGVVEAATGTGKTAVAFAAMEKLHNEVGDFLRIAIVVPTRVLARQWREELITTFGMSPLLIGEQHTDAQVEWTPKHPILIAVVNSARIRLERVLDGWRKQGLVAFLVVDECHRAGSEHNSRIFEGRYDYALGLSATPERDDNGHEEHVYPGLGGPIFRYSLLKALDDGILAPVTSINYYVDFSKEEQRQWAGLKQDIGSAIMVLRQRYPSLNFVPPSLLLKEVSRLTKDGDTLARRIQKLLATRRELLATARERVECQRDILNWIAKSGERSLIFHETIAAAEASYSYLVEHLGVRAVLDHSNMSKDNRTGAAEHFRQDRSQVLVAVRALDEGVDVPDASVAVIVAGSRSRRQRIQRFGRVLRQSGDKRAVVMSILVRGTPEEAGVGSRDEQLLGIHRVRHHRWPHVGVSGLGVTGIASSYRPAGAEYSEEDALTFLPLGLVRELNAHS